MNLINPNESIDHNLLRQAQTAAENGYHWSDRDLLDLTNQITLITRIADKLKKGNQNDNN